MPRPRTAVLVRTYFWDDYAARSAARLLDRSEGMDFYVQANETDTGPLDVRPFHKLAHVAADFEALGLPCVAPAGRPPLWWSCDYSLYDALLKLPDYDWYLSIECDVAANADLLPLTERVAAAGHDCLTPFDPVPMRDTWPHAASCAGMPYDDPAWTPLPIMLLSRRAMQYLFAQRRRLARMHDAGQLGGWPISEGFFSSALRSGGYGTASLHRFADLTHFGSEAIYLEDDPCTRIEGGFAHSVLDPDRFWSKFVARAYRVWLGRCEYAQMQHARQSLLGIGRRCHEGWRISAEAGNLALDRPARQSSISAWSRAGLRRAADPTTADARGGNSGVLTGGFGFHTAQEDSPWWQVDLGADCAVVRVRIYNSLQAAERARRLRIGISSDGLAWHEVFRKADDRVFAGNDDPLECLLPQPVQARYVRVTLDGMGVLSLGEIEVYGSGP